ncbi:hypothetical protein FA95DRAFT_952106 [Auriscalpium vulgare]|uniref:Uncharacterized protein n=1 Tax=Auriscalpium vulgare TaxID=40419 RepID=A0ACB8R7C0_9AGAM|nr:hypothetical protein FA95DRAFT_952106 [Auriscalpium vulgare]
MSRPLVGGTFLISCFPSTTTPELPPCEGLAAGVRRARCYALDLPRARRPARTRLVGCFAPAGHRAMLRHSPSRCPRPHTR